MNGYGFSEEVRAVLAQAHTEAQGFGHEYIGTEHMLLALVTPPSPTVAKLLATRNVGPAEIRATVEAIVKRGRASARPDLPYTSSAKRILELAMSEARELGSEAVTTGHLFLGAMREHKGIAAQSLDQLGFTLDAVRDQFLTLTVAGEGERAMPVPDQLVARAVRSEMPPMAAVAALQLMMRSPRVAAVFEHHAVDVQAIIRDLSALPPAT